jgi:hypothetical protein
MKTILLTLIIFASLLRVNGQEYISKATGSWTDDGSWTSTHYPGSPSTPDIILTNDIKVFIKNDITLDGDLTINNNDEFHITNNSTLRIKGDVTINNNFIINIELGSYLIIEGNLTLKNNTTGTINGNLTIYGDLTAGNGSADVTGTGSVVVGGKYTDNGTFSSDLIIGSIFYSKQSGNWNDQLNWAKDAAGTIAATSIPDNRNTVIIQNLHTITVSSTVEVKNLTIRSGGQLSISAGITLSVGEAPGETGSIINDGTIIINTKGDGGLIFNDAAIAGIGTTQVKLTTIGPAYHHVSSPFTAAPVSNFTSRVGANFYYYDEPAQTANWIANWKNPTGNMVPGKGYAAYTPNTTSSPITISGGSFNTGDITIPMTITAHTSPLQPSNERSDSCNLIGNPYPCNISLTKFIFDNPTVKCVYLWADDGSGGTGYTSSDYSTLNRLDQTKAANGKETNKFAGPCQGFFVKAIGPTPSTVTAKFTNDMKTTSTAVFFKSKEKSAPTDNISKLGLQLSDGKSLSSIVIGMVDDATMGPDLYYDAAKLIGTQKIIFYSLIGSQIYAIQGIPHVVKDDINVPLGYKLNSAGSELEISATKIENLDALVEPILVDKLLNKQIKLRVNPIYKFTTSGTVNDRFEILFHRRDSVTTRFVGEDFADINLPENWDNGVPDATKSVVVPNNKKLRITGNFVCRDLTIEPTAMVAVEALANLTIQHPVILKSSGKFTGQLKDEGEHEITIKAEKEFVNGATNYFSSPVESANANLIGNDVELLAQKELLELDNETKIWKKITKSTETFKPMNGFSLTGIENGKRVFEGTANTGLKFIGLEPGLNLIGNPYPTHIDWGSTTAQAGWIFSENTHQSIYYAVQNEIEAGQQNFAVYNRLIGAGLNGGQRVIAPMQSFFVYNDTSSFLAINNEAKTALDKIDFEPEQKTNGLFLKVSQGNFSDEALVAFNAKAGDAYDAYDAKKLLASSAKYPQVYLLGEQNIQFAINALRNDKDYDLPVGVKAPALGTLSLSFADFNGLFANPEINIYLEDKLTGSLANAKSSEPYNFTVSLTGEINDRFVLHISKSVVWMGKNWTKANGPVQSDNVTIAANYAEAANIECNNLTINAGKTLTIKSGQYVAVKGNLTNNAGAGGILVKAGASFLHQTAGIQGAVEMELAGGGNLGSDRKWHLIGAPVTEVSSTNLAGMDIYNYLQSAASASVAWPKYNGTIQPGQGFLAYSPVFVNKSITGIFNQGDIELQNLPYDNTIATHKGFNLVSNPFPSIVDWDLVQAQSANIDHTLWTWNSDNFGYATYDDNGASVNGGSRYIQPCQGFFVKAENSVNTLKFSNAVRLGKVPATKKGSIANSIKLKISDNSFTDETMVYFANETSGSKKLLSLSSAVPQIYVKEGNSDFAISHYALPVVSKDIPLNVFCGKSGSFTISVSDFTFDANITATLEDLSTKQMFTLTSANSYKFDYTTGEPAGRFILHLKTVSTSIDEPISNKVNIYSASKMAYIESKEELSGFVSVWNMVGNQILCKTVQGNQSQIDLSAFNSGIYIVKYESAGLTVTKKLSINN